MRLVHTEYNITVTFEENRICVLYIENPNCFTCLVQDLWFQQHGQDGSWILSEADKELPIAKSMESIVNPLATDSNDRRILKILYQDIAQDMQEKYLNYFTDVNAKMADFISRLLEEQPYPLEMCQNPDILDLLKVYDVRFDTESSELCERLISYLKICHQVGKVKCFAFVNLKSYLSDTEYVVFCKQIFYEKIHVLLLESCCLEKKFDFESVKIIDTNLCEVSF
jgi:CRISPR type II-A-associated protein Csn2